jgi:hypothetical protein
MLIFLIIKLLSVLKLAITPNYTNRISVFEPVARIYPI